MGRHDKTKKSSSKCVLGKQVKVANDSVTWEVLCDILTEYGIPEKIVKII